MRFSSFIAQRIFFNKYANEATKPSPIIRIPILGVALCSAVMLVAVAVTLGFKHQAATYARASVGDLSISRFRQSENGTHSFECPEALLKDLRSVPGITEVSPIVASTAIFKTDSAFVGLPIIGIDSNYHMGSLADLVVAGIPPPWNQEKLTHNPVMITREVADKLSLSVGDALRLYMISGASIRVRKLRVEAIYLGTNRMTPALIPIGLLRRILSWGPTELTHIRLMTSESNTTQMQAFLVDHLSQSQHISQDFSFGVSRAEDINPQMFSWLETIDSNVYILLGLMALVAGFTMIAGLTILVLDKTQLIGTLKALGADDMTVRTIFVRLSLFLIAEGLLWGNLLSILLCAVQKYLKLIKLDRTLYFMDHVPIEIDWLLWGLVDLAIVVLIGLMLLIPSKIISRITPSQVMRFE